jgi:septal ring factor EnvC (AmiA/AmiB activator)
MLRRSSRSPTALDHSKEELARRESALREEVEKLERMIADAPRVAEEITRQQREELLQRASEGRSRLDVAVGLQDKRYGDDDGGGSGRPRGAMRKERREGRIVFIVLMIALAAAVIWLISHLQHF